VQATESYDVPTEQIDSFDVEPATGPNTQPAPEIIPDIIAPVEPVTPEVVAAEPTPAPSPFAEQAPISVTAPSSDLAASMASELQNEAAPVAPAAPVAGRKKSKKGIVIGGIIALILGLLGGGSAVAYSVYQSPQKVIFDSIMSAVNAKTATVSGTISVDSKDSTTAIKLSVKQNENSASLNVDLKITSGGKDYTFTGDGVATASGDFYVKLSKLDSIATTLTSLANAQLGSSASSAALVQKLVAKVDGTWVKLSSDELKAFNVTASAVQSCSNSAIAKFKNDSSAIKELSDLFQMYPFISVEKDLGVVNGSIGYQLKADKSNTTSFVDGLKSTKIYTALHDCDKTFTLDASSLTIDNANSGGNIELWATEWTHQLTKVVIDGTSDGNTIKSSFEPVFNQPVTIDAPATSTTLTQLFTDLTSTAKTGK
jgi:hypothetical protein